MDTTGLLGATKIKSAFWSASIDAGCGLRLLEADEGDGQRIGTGMEPYPILLKVHRSAASGCLRIRDRHMRLDAIIGHGEQSELSS